MSNVCAKKFLNYRLYTFWEVLPPEINIFYLLEALSIQQRGKKSCSLCLWVGQKSVRGFEVQQSGRDCFSKSLQAIERSCEAFTTRVRNRLIFQTSFLPVWWLFERLNGSQNVFSWTLRISRIQNFHRWNVVPRSRSLTDNASPLNLILNQLACGTVLN